MTKLKLRAIVPVAASSIDTTYVGISTQYKTKIWPQMTKMKLRATVSVARSYVHTNVEAYVGISMWYFGTK